MHNDNRPAPAGSTSSVADFEMFDEVPGLPPPGWSALVAEKLHKNPDKWLLWPYSIVRSQEAGEYILDRVWDELKGRQRGLLEVSWTGIGKFYLRFHPDCHDKAAS